jgi:group II intron reverse transcriptase/maturase
VAVSFDTVSHEWLLRFLKHRIGDERILRLISKWLKAGVLEDGLVTESEVGTPQGATASPLLANVYLHYVFDLWVQQWRKRHARGEMIVVRYADDTVLGFEHEVDARRCLADLRKRAEAFALSLHPDKTRLIRFGRYAALNRKERGLGKPETFNFLGFTVICGTNRTGGFQLLRKTRRDRLQATVQRVKEELQRRRHEPIPVQGQWLGQVIRGFNAYHAVPTNYQSLVLFRVRVIRLWKRALMRRGQRKIVPWSRMMQLPERYLPRPRILHPWPERRFAVKHPRWEPCA